ncbi:MAG: cysteine desulfurase family protein [Patescibacteria group bacterium]
MPVKKSIYLDNSATTPIDPRVLKEMLPYLKENFGNASSLHYAGLDNRVAVDRAQAKLAKFLNGDKEEVYFTSGATESDNMAIFGPIRALQRRYPGKKWHIIISQIEHDAVLAAGKEMEKEGVEVTYLPVNSRGLVEIEALQDAIKNNTVLISIMYVNNEVGTIQPIAEIGKLISEINKKRKSGRDSLRGKDDLQKIYFHTDATQALAYYPCDVQKLAVDLLSLSGHKIYGPKGVGAIYIKNGTPFLPIIFGGHQQNNIRPGTYNVAGIVGLGQAVELLSDQKAREKENKKIRELRDYLVKMIMRIPHLAVNGDTRKRAPNNASFIIEGVEGESALLMLSEKGIAVSTGSACSSGSLEPSHVLLAMGIKPELAHGSLRVTLGRFNKKSDVDVFIKELPPIVAKLRKMSPIKIKV